ncbi:MAG: hypothetical protein ACKVPX_00750 [Myxococcaceae bacterium]
MTAFFLTGFLAGLRAGVRAEARRLVPFVEARRFFRAGALRDDALSAGFRVLRVGVFRFAVFRFVLAMAGLLQKRGER